MVESPKYERLKALMRLSAEPLGAEDLSEDTRVGDAHSDVGIAKGGSEEFVADLSVGLSQTKEGADGNGCPPSLLTQAGIWTPSNQRKLIT